MSRKIDMIMPLPKGNGLALEAQVEYAASHLHTGYIVYSLNLDENSIPDEAEIRLSKNYFFFVDRRSELVECLWAVDGPASVWNKFNEFIQQCRA